MSSLIATVNCIVVHFIFCLGAREVVESALRCIFGAEAAHISLLYFLTYAAYAGGLEPIISCKENFGGQELKIKVTI